MRQIIGQGDSTKIGKYKVIVEGATSNANQMQPTQHRIFIKPKRIRSAFTTEQINYLEKQYKKFQYINGEQRKQVATFLDIGERSVKIWFQNRRMKEKKENNKEFDDETSSDKEFGKDQLNNVPALPSANDQYLYSLPVLPSAVDTPIVANTDNTKTNKFKNKEKSPTEPEKNKKGNFEPKPLDSRANYYKEVSHQTMTPYYHAPTSDITLPFETDRTIKRPLFQERRSSSAEFSINLCKRYKQECAATIPPECGNIAYEGQNTKKSEPRQPRKNTNFCNSPKDCPTSMNKRQTYASTLKQPNFSNTSYYPMLPSVYPPFMSSGGVLWKPVNFMPFMATTAPPLSVPDHQESSAHEQDKSCKCNCHGNTPILPMTMPPNMQNPYAQYLITVPFPQTSPDKF